MPTPQPTLHRCLLLVIVVALALLVQLSSSPSPPALAQSPPDGPPPLTVPAPEIILEADPTYVPARVPPPPLRDDGVGVQAIPFTVNFNPPTCSANITAWPAQAQAAFSYAANIWATLLDGPVMPIQIDACYRTDLGTSTLGSAGSNSLYSFTPSGGQPSFYPVALRNQLTGVDVNGASAEIIANFNANQAAWYFGTDGNPAFGQYDFISVVLHEIGHGLGFAGSFNYNNMGSGTVCGGTLGAGCWRSSGTPNIYDRFTENGSGQSMLNTGLFPNPSTTLGSQLTSNNLYFDGPNTVAVNGGPAKLYAPGAWNPGSSFSHLDEIFNNTPSALMTYSLSNGESAHHPGPVTLGVLRDLGWSLEDGAELLVTKSASSSALSGGDRLTYTLNVTNGGPAAVNNVILTDIVPANTTLDPSSLSGDAAYTGTSAGSTITWTTNQNLTYNQSLNRTFDVLVYNSIPAGTSVTNQAQATAANMDQIRPSNTVISLANGAGCGFSDGFESGLSQFWTPQTTNTGQAAIISNSSVAHTGNFSVWFRDLTTDGTFSQSAFILKAFLAGTTNVDFSFWVYRADPAPGTIDGVFLSDDGGNTWTKVHNFSSNSRSVFQNVVLDLDQLAATHGLTLNNNFRIKLQGDSDRNLYNDGYVIDDVALACDSSDRSSLTIVKTATPADGTNFLFDAGSLLGAFILDDASPDDGDGVTDTQTFDNLVAGPYQVTETIPVNWALTGVSCQGANSSTVTPGPTGVSLDLAAGEDVTCTFTNEQSTAITLVSFTATPGKSSVTLAWETATEINTAGFNLHRATALAGPYTQINAILIPATGDAVTGATYSYPDTAATAPGTVYYYKLEEIDLTTGSTFYGPVSTANKDNGSIYLPLVVK